ncbi:hypothetical protein CPAV1605_222 [seawater metagenome]|uniref:Protein kinase domain-containing protein n=1 Tax=seawater metagenome TaxID=1561972 RepID=A0A5E8CLU8_9ZZZZ
MSIQLVYKFFLFIFLSGLSILNKFYLVPDIIYNSLALWLLAKIGPAFIKISQVSQNNFLDADFRRKKRYLNILDNLYVPKNINSCVLNKNKDIKIIKPLSIGSGSIAYVYQILYKTKPCILKEYFCDSESIFSGIALFKLLINIGLIAHNSILFKIISYKSYHKYFLDQVNSQQEVKNMEIFYRIFEDSERINIPKCFYFDKNHIIMSQEKGLSLFNFVDLYKKNDDIMEQTYLLLFFAIYKMCQERIIHGDFHAGNLLFYIHDEKVKMSIVDFGIILKITSDQQKFFLNSFDNIEDYHKMDRKKQFANFFWYFGEHSQNYTQEDFIKRVTQNIQTANIILPPANMMYIPEGGVDILINQELLEMGFQIKIENYNMLITLEILMNKIVNLANFNKNFNKKLRKFIADNIIATYEF